LAELRILPGSSNCRNRAAINHEFGPGDAIKADVGFPIGTIQSARNSSSSKSSPEYQNAEGRRVSQTCRKRFPSNGLFAVAKRGQNEEVGNALGARSEQTKGTSFGLTLLCSD
jgi:hypothetical protein